MLNSGTRGDDVEPLSDHRFDGSQHGPPNGAGQGKILAHHFAGMSEGSNRNHRRDVIVIRGVIDRCGSSDRVSDDGNIGNVIALPCILNSSTEILGESQHRDMIVVLRQTVAPSVEEQRVESCLSDSWCEVEHVGCVATPPMKYNNSWSVATSRDEPTVQPDTSWIREPNLLFGEPHIRWRPMDFSQGRAPCSLEQPWRRGHNAGPDDERYCDASSHARRIGIRHHSEYGRVGIVGIPMDIEALMQDRKDKDEFFGLSPQSPIPDQDRGTFSGLAFFDPNPDLVFTVQPAPVEPTPVTIQTTTGEVRTYHRVATVTLAIDATDVVLALYSTGHDGLFLPFRDATSGNRSYGAGRYLDIAPNENGSITIDFNYAYAPFCAYSEQYSCALPPRENWMSVSIEAGERTAE